MTSINIDVGIAKLVQDKLTKEEKFVFEVLSSARIKDYLDEVE